jgi:hypothetical protein
MGLPGLIVNLQYSATEGDMNIALQNLRDWCSFDRAIPLFANGAGQANENRQAANGLPVCR